MVPAEVEKITAEILEKAGSRPSGDISGQIFCLTQAICLLALIMSRKA
jgi:hypothetical protein